MLKNYVCYNRRHLFFLAYIYTPCIYIHVQFVWKIFIDNLDRYFRVESKKWTRETRHIIGALFSVVKRSGGSGERAVAKATFSESAHVAAIRALSRLSAHARTQRVVARFDAVGIFFSFAGNTRSLTSGSNTYLIARRNRWFSATRERVLSFPSAGRIRAEDGNGITFNERLTEAHVRRRVIVFKWPRVKNRRRPTVTRAANSDTSPLSSIPPSPNSNASLLPTRFVLYVARCVCSQIPFFVPARGTVGHFFRWKLNWLNERLDKFR